MRTRSRRTGTPTSAPSLLGTRPPNRPPAPPVLYSPGKREPYDDAESDSSASDGSGSDSEGSDSSEESSDSRSDEDARREKPKSSISPVVIVLAVLLIIAIGVAVYFGVSSMQSESDSESTASSGTTAASTAGSSAGGSASHGASDSSSSRTSTTDSKPSSSHDKGSATGKPSASQTGGGDDDATTEPTATDEPTATQGDASQTATSTDSAATAASSSDDSFINTCLTTHNDFRATHHADALVWNETLADAASRWVDNCVFEHSGGSLLSSGYGENLFAYSGTGVNADSEVDPQGGIEGWNSEEATWNYDDPASSTGDTGHFTQSVWVATTDVGCSMKPCVGVMSAGEWGYFPAGNVMWGNAGEDPYKFFKENVLAP